MNIISLNGRWDFQQQGQNDWQAATVPGTVHTDLLTAGEIPDPFYRTNEKDLFWIGESDWSYRRTFEVSETFLAQTHILLRCDGLDTLATISLNGIELGQTDNQFRTYEFDAKPHLRVGDNILLIHFAAPSTYGQQRLTERNLPAWGAGVDKIAGGNWLRKSPCNFGWDWGPMVPTVGIWRDIALVGYDTARLIDIHIQQHHHDDGLVTLDCEVALESANTDADLTVAFDLRLNGQTIDSATVACSQNGCAVSLVVETPALWWPNGMGEQPLYRLDIQLQHQQQTIDAQAKRIGLRTLALVREPDEWGESFYFACNGVPFFAKGANWIPTDSFVTRITGEHYERILQTAVSANMNMLRVWGGGIYEPDVFYDLCDEMGICIWQDFIFGCATYPTFDADWMATVEVEAVQNIKRIRHHACLALWCGNNELEQGLVGDTWTASTMSWHDYSRLYDQLLPRLVAEHDPQTDYWPSSPHTPLGNRLNFNDPTNGDAHLWSVWHGKEPFEWYRTCEHRFNSEFGFQSFPEPRTIYSFTEPADRNVTSQVMEHHQRSGIGNQTIIHYMLDWFKLPTSFESTVWLSQILQGMAIKYACEHWRRSMPRGMGTLYWQLNDCWQVASWSSVDYFGRWKTLHYMARDFFAPLLVSGLDDWEKGTVEIHVTSDLLEEKMGEVDWQLTTATGEPIERGTLPVAIAANGNTVVETLDLKTAVSQYGPNNLLLWLDLTVDDTIVSTNLVLMARPKHLLLEEPHVQTAVSPLSSTQFTVTLTTKRPALWAWLELPHHNASYSNNFVHLAPNEPTTIIITLEDDEVTDTIMNTLRVSSLVDTFA
ncbi:MAG: glycoside hydrolase family 2 protein [Chloroflexota bacterium]